VLLFANIFVFLIIRKVQSASRQQEKVSVLALPQRNSSSLMTHTES
jgi:hypothetical protein